METKQQESVSVQIYPLVARLSPDAFDLPVAIELISPLGFDSYSMIFTLLHLEQVVFQGDIHLEDHELDTLHNDGFLRLNRTIGLDSMASHMQVTQGCGLGIQLEVGFPHGLSAICASAIDIGTGPLRYGFLSDFLPTDAPSREEAVRFLLENHISHVQFYDWAYRPHQFAPPVSDHTPDIVYRDTMGKQIDLLLVKRLISRLHTAGMKALGYGAVYAAGLDYIQEHPQEALYDYLGNTIDLIGKFFIMNCALENPWRKRILEQYMYAVETVGFDGIHMDTYGFPKSAWDHHTVLQHLDTQFVSLITAWGEHGDENIFNNVGGWPAKQTGKANQAAVYIEVWPPHTHYHHLRVLINDALLSKKPVILAAYLEPFKSRGSDDESALICAQILTAAVCSLGATHLLFGECGAVLTQPYYSDYSILTTHEKSILRQYSDFQVRYRDLLYDTDLEDITESHALGENQEFEFKEIFTTDEAKNLIISKPLRLSFDGEAGSIWVVVKRSPKRLVMHFINLLNQADSLWNKAKLPISVQPNLSISVPRYSKTMHFFTASPDSNQCSARELFPKEVQGIRMPAQEVELESIGVWSTIWVDLD